MITKPVGSDSRQRYLISNFKYDMERKQTTMQNEILLAASLIFIFGGVLIMYRIFGKIGLFCASAIATITANIEVLLLVDAYGMEQTLGNVLFAATFLITDILSENHSRKDAEKAVNIGIATSISFILISQSWLLYSPAANDWAHDSFVTIFTNTPRIMIVSLVVYAICQRFDVWAYHKWWEFTKNFSGDAKSFLWLRNNGSTMLSQLLNTILYSFGAFWGIYDTTTIIHICISSYVIYLATSLADTPAVYLARRIKKSIPDEG